MTPDMRTALAAVGQMVRFAKGQVLRHQGAFAPDMLLIEEGEVDCALSEEGSVHLKLSPGTVVGERGFLTGKAANATLTAVTDVEALSLNSAALVDLQRNHPAIATEVLRHLARVMSEREAENRDILPATEASDGKDFEIVRCSTLDQMRVAQRLRYDVYCLEFGRESQYADPDEGTIIDDLDKTGVSFVAYHDRQPVGTVRVNLGRDGDLGVLPELYGIEASDFPVEESSVITKYAIRESHRGGSTYIRLFGAIGTYVNPTPARAIFIDCVPPLARFYATMGFKRSAEDFVHYENGLSVPMVLDLDEYTARMPFDERYRRNRWR